MIRLLFFLLPFTLFSQSKLMTPFEQNKAQSANYQQVMAFYEALEKQYPQYVKREIIAQGTDIGEPFTSVIVSKSGLFTPKEAREKGKSILFINNAIHPGEPEGIDATMMFVRDVLAEKMGKNVLNDIVLVIIPVYNIDGCLNRGSFSRANQEGPEEYGFRGNAKNLDLNRDFIKCDSRNAQSFNQVFGKWSPDVLVDNHTSNGADYQYTMTYISTQPDKLPPVLGTYLREKMNPFLEKKMIEKGWEMCPYVMSADETPDAGIFGFDDTPRYSTGYAALHNTIGFMPETHMLKPFEDRVKSTYAFMEVVLQFIFQEKNTIYELRKKAEMAYLAQTKVAISWEIDEAQQDTFHFKGYEAKYKPSEISGFPRLYYDRNAPWEKDIPYWNRLKPVLEIKKPAFYLVPQAYTELVNLLKMNGVEVIMLEKDEVFEVEMYYIKDFKSPKTPYESHFLHSQVQVEKVSRKQPFHKGDFKVVANRFAIETLEPQAPDSYFAWNRFDGILQQKEYFSAYIFEDTAAEWLKQNPALRQELEEKKKNDKDFAASGDAQLEWVYKHSLYYEPTHNLYPIGRLGLITTD